MNTLIVGFDRTPILKHLPDRFLLIDDGPLIDQLALPRRRARTVFDLNQHSFNPLKDMDYRRAREFIAVLDAVFPEGSDTLTRRYSNYHLLEALLEKPKRLETLIHRTKETEDAWQKIQTLLKSPVLERVLNHPTNVSLKGTLIVRLDRAVLGDFDAFVLGNLLISLYEGPVVVPDFGFYACPWHVSLIRQNRLIAGVASLREIPDFRHHLLLMDRKIPSRTTYEDAEALAPYLCPFLPGTDGYSTFLQSCMTVPESELDQVS